MPLEIKLLSEPSHNVAADLLVVGVLQSGAKGGLNPALKPLDGALGGALAKAVAKEEFTGKRDQALTLATLGRIPADKIVLHGLGERRAIDAPAVRTFAAKAARTANNEKATSLALSVPAGLEGELRAVAEGLELGAYRFTKYFTGERKPKANLTTVSVTFPTKLRPTAKAAIALGQKVA